MYNCLHQVVEMEHLDDPISDLTWPQHRPDWFNNVEKRNNGQKRKADDNSNEVTTKKLKLEQHQGSTSRLQEDTDEPIASTSEGILDIETMLYLRNTFNFTLLQDFLFEMAEKAMDSIMSLNE